MAREAGIKASRQPGVRSLLDNVTRKRPTVSRVASQSLAMATKETGDRRSADWTARYNRRGRAESADLMPRRGMGVSDGQDREAPLFSAILALPPISLLPTLESQHFSRFYAFANQVLSVTF